MMSSRLEDLAMHKELLLARATLCRLTIRHDLAALGGPLSWARASAKALAAAPVISGLLGVLLPLLARGRFARFAGIASRLVFVARTANAVRAAMRRRQRSDSRPY